MPFSGIGSANRPTTPPARPERAIAVAALGLVLLAQPFLGIFDRGSSVTVAGVPLLFVYLFAAWTVIVALTGVVMESRQSPDIPPGEDGEGPVTSGDVAAADNGRDAAASDSGS